MSDDQERALEQIAATLRTPVGRPCDDLASDVLDDLSSAGFMVREAWTIDHDVLVTAFRAAAVVYEPTLIAWTPPTLAEATEMAEVIERLLNPCPECKGSGRIARLGTDGIVPCEHCAATGIAGPLLPRLGRDERDRAEDEDACPRCQHARHPDECLALVASWDVGDGAQPFPDECGCDGPVS